MMKAQAWHEAGKPYPMTDAEWAQAQAMVFATVVAEPAQPTLRPGDSGPDVTHLQHLLGCAETGTYDERSETEYALRLFQTRNALTPDGICGPITWAKLLKGPST